MIFENLKKTYGEKTVLDIDKIEFDLGKIYAIVGANGSGKSTFLKVIAKQIKSDEKANLDFDGKKVCYMPQKSFAFKMTTYKNVLLATKGREEDKARADKLMCELKIDHLADQKANALSGGETARMALCRTIMNGAEVLLLDEPTAAMDIESTKITEDVIVKQKTEGKTIVIVTHSMSQARRIADEVVFMKDGKVIERGEISSILDNPKTSEMKEFLEFFSSEI